MDCVMIEHEMQSPSLSIAAQQLIERGDERAAALTSPLYDDEASRAHVEGWRAATIQTEPRRRRSMAA